MYRVTIVVIVVTNELPNATYWLATLGEGAEHVKEHSLAPVKWGQFSAYRICVVYVAGYSPGFSHYFRMSLPCPTSTLDVFNLLKNRL